MLSCYQHNTWVDCVCSTDSFITNLSGWVFREMLAVSPGFMVWTLFRWNVWNKMIVRLRNIVFELGIAIFAGIVFDTFHDELLYGLWHP